MAKKERRSKRAVLRKIKRKRISKAIFIAGVFIAGIGIYLLDKKVLLAIRLMLAGAVIAWMGWLLTEYYEWLDERENYKRRRRLQWE